MLKECPHRQSETRRSGVARTSIVSVAQRNKVYLQSATRWLAAWYRQCTPQLLIVWQFTVGSSRFFSPARLPKLKDALRTSTRPTILKRLSTTPPTLTPNISGYRSHIPKALQQFEQSLTPTIRSYSRFKTCRHQPKSHPSSHVGHRDGRWAACQLVDCCTKALHLRSSL